MPKKSFTEEQIVAALREAESGVPIVEVCHRVGVTETTFFPVTDTVLGCQGFGITGSGKVTGAGE